MRARPGNGRPVLAGRLLLWLVACCLTTSAQAHGTSGPSRPTVRAVLATPSAALSGLHIEIRRTLAPQLLVTNPGNQTLRVMDGSGRAFLKIGPDNVRADLGDAAFHRSNTLMAAGAFAADASAKAHWQTVASDPSWGWFDMRLRTDQIDVPHSVVDAGRRATVGHWSIPVRLGDTRTEIRGHFEFVPPPRGITEARVVDTGLPDNAALVRALTGSNRPGLFMSYHGTQPLIVAGRHGEPLFRFTGRRVEANRHSSTWAAITPAGSPDYQPAPPGTAPAWAQVSSSAGYGWIEPRATYHGTVDKPDQSSTVKHWRIPITIGDHSSAIQGVTEWRPITHSATANPD